jgi:hypothetical protein
LLALAVLHGSCADERAPRTLPVGPPEPAADASSPIDAQVPSPRPDGGPRLPPADTEILLPREGGPTTHRIELEADLGALDVHLSVDTTASIAGEISALQADLNEHITPELRARVPSVSFGVSRFEDFPHEPFGYSGAEGGTPPDRPFQLLTRITSDETALALAVAQLDRPLGYGGDGPESGAEALYQIATGDGYEHDGEQLIAAFDPSSSEGDGMLGGVGFREDALRVVLHITDATSHTPEDYGFVFPRTHDLEQAGDALRKLDARVVSIVSGVCGAKTMVTDCNDARHAAARAELEQLALQTRAFEPAEDESCSHGLNGKKLPAIDDRCPLVFDASPDGVGLSATLVDAIVRLVDSIRFDRVRAIVVDDPLGFVQRIAAVEVRQAHGIEPPMLADREPEGAPDGIDDSFEAVRSRARLAFDLTLDNRRLPAAERARSFRVVVRVVGDELLVGERILRIVVPATTD